MRRCLCLALLSLLLWQASSHAQSLTPIQLPADIADVPAQDILIDDDPMQRYFLIGLSEDQPAAEAGYPIVIVLPGGAGGADFLPFVRRIHKHSLPPGWLIAQPVAPTWDDQQKEQIVWPSSAFPYPAAKFTTESFIDQVISDVSARTKLNENRRYLLAWSSGGPAAYAAILRKDSCFEGAFIAMSAGPPAKLDLAQASGRKFYLFQSEQDTVTRFWWARAAQLKLASSGATVTLKPYEGGHGWHGPVFQQISAGLTWLDTPQP